jgi:hypothetical protein
MRKNMDESTVQLQAAKVQSMLATLQGWDFSPCHILAEKLGTDRSLLAEFARDPVGVAKREVGYTPPDGFHMHFMDERLVLIPPEGDADAQLIANSTTEAWSRIEIRSGHKLMCLFNCGTCNS